jgi:excisionase family DNA binding protein
MAHEKTISDHENQTGQSKRLTLAQADEQLLDFYLDMPKKLGDNHFAETARAAEIADVTQRTVQLWIEGGLVRAVFVGGKYRVSLSSLREHLKNQAANRLKL